MTSTTFEPATDPVHVDRHDPTVVSIVGGHGQIARLLGRRLVSANYRVRGLIRSSDQSADLLSDGTEPILCDIERSGHDELDAALRGSDVVVFAAGAGPDSGPERKNSLDRDGAIAAVESASRVGADRFVIVSSMGADDPPQDDETFSIFLRAKHDADAAVRSASGVDTTIVRPGALTDDGPTGSVDLGISVSRSKIPRADVAAVLAELIESGRGVDCTMEVVSGRTPIADAVRSLT